VEHFEFRTAPSSPVAPITRSAPHSLCICHLTSDTRYPLCPSCLLLLLLLLRCCLLLLLLLLLLLPAACLYQCVGYQLLPAASRQPQSQSQSQPSYGL
jgi:hypothetical protein